MVYGIVKKSYFDNFPVEYNEIVLRTVNSFKITNPSYYDIIVRIWGSNYNTLIRKTITYEEKKTLIGAIQKTRMYIKEVENGEFKGFRGLNIDEDEENEIVKTDLNHSNCGQYVKDAFLDYFDSKDEDLVLLIVNEFEKYYPNYYFAINYFYMGDKYQIKKKWVKYNKDISVLFNSSRIKINKIINKFNSLEEIDKTDKKLNSLIISRNSSPIYLKNNLNEAFEEIGDIKEDIPFNKSLENEKILVSLNDVLKMSDDEIDCRLERISKQGKEIIKMYFGIGTEKQSLEEIALKYSMKKYQVLSLIKKTVYVIRNNVDEKVSVKTKTICKKDIKIEPKKEIYVSNPLETYKMNNNIKKFVKVKI